MKRAIFGKLRSFTTRKPGTEGSFKTGKSDRVVKMDLEQARERLAPFFEVYNGHVSCNSFGFEYDSVRQASDLSPGYRERLTERSPEVDHRNRYTDIRCLDATRVKLLGRENDYINASRISPANVPGARSYIAAQAPLPHTLEDFWHMCWQEVVPVILMVTPFQEVSNGHTRVKAHPYFPLDEGSELTIGGFTITCVSETRDDSLRCGLRRFQLSNGDSIRELTHIHFENWPDFGHVEDFSGVVKLMQMLDDGIEQHPNLDGPVVVHCSAGVGRTGTFIALDIIRREIQHALRDTTSSAVINVSVSNVVTRLRNERPAMVVTAGQYEMIYHGLYYMFHTKNEYAQTVGTNTASVAATDDRMYASLLSNSE